jgi:hypothetical protein
VDTVQITSVEPPTANAGTDQSVCESTAGLSATGSGIWTVLSGSVALSDPGNPQSQVSGLFPGQNVYIWTVEGGICPADADTVLINRFVSNLNLGNDTTLCPGDFITLTLDNSFQNILWSDGSSGNSFTIDSAGTYFVQAYGSGNCLWADTLQVGTCTATSSVKSGKVHVSVAPNPCRDSFRIKLSGMFDSGFRVRLISVNGAELFKNDYQVSHYQSEHLVKPGMLPPGLYMLEIRSENHLSRHRLQVW